MEISKKIESFGADLTNFSQSVNGFNDTKTVDQIKREIKAMVNEAAAQGTLIDSMCFRYMETMGGPAYVVDMEVMERVK